MPALSTPKTIQDFLARLATGGVKTLRGDRPSGVGEWGYLARYDEGPDALYPKAHAVPGGWVRAAVRAGMVRPGRVDHLAQEDGRVIEFLIPATLPAKGRKGKAKAPPITGEALPPQGELLG